MHMGTTLIRFTPVISTRTFEHPELYCSYGALSPGFGDNAPAVMHTHAKLAPALRKEVYQTWEREGCSLRELGRRYHVDKRVVARIIERGKRGDFSLHDSTNHRFKPEENAGEHNRKATSPTGPPSRTRSQERASTLSRKRH